MYLNLTIHSPVGKFVGPINKSSTDTVSDLTQLRDKMEANSNSLGYVVIYNKSGEVCIPGEVMKNSVVEYHIEDKPRGC